MVQDRPLSMQFFTPQGIRRVIWRFSCENCFPTILDGHPEFQVKCNNAFISETVRDRVISTISVPRGICRAIWRFSAIFDTIINAYWGAAKTARAAL